MSIQNYFGKPNLEFKKNHMIPCFEYFDKLYINNTTPLPGSKYSLMRYNNAHEILNIEYNGNTITVDYIDSIRGAIDKKKEETSIFNSELYVCKYNPHHTFKFLRPVIQELYDHDDQLIENQKLMMNQINSLQETVKLLRKQKEDDQKRFDKLEKEYQQLLINWTTITDYMMRIDAMETKLFPPPPPKKAN